MNRLRPPKKSETLEVRLPHAVKQAFMARARTQGRTASAVLREFVDSYLAGASPPEARPMIKRYLKPAAATTAAASALALYALTPSAVAAAPDLKSVFAELDRDRDGAISSAEFIDRQTDVLSARITRALHRVELAQARAHFLTTLGIEVR